jgi:hypothetical protein
MSLVAKLLVKLNSATEGQTSIALAFFVYTFSFQYDLNFVTMVHEYKYYVFGHYPLSGLYLKHRPIYFSKHVSETGFCLRLQVKPTQLGPIDSPGPYLEPKENKQDGVLDRDKVVGNVQKHICI